jgi:hypothetical protein
LQDVRKHEDERLTSYGWVDKNAGRVRIPIDRAMDLVLQRGLPFRAAPVPGGAGAPKTGRSEGNVPSEGMSFPAGAGGAKDNVEK